MCGYCLSVDIFVIYGYSLLYSGHYIGSILLLYVADFLLVNIYTLRNRLRNKVLRESVSGNVADLALFNA